MESVNDDNEISDEDEQLAAELYNLAMGGGAA